MIGSESVGSIVYEASIDTKKFKKDAGDLENSASKLSDKIGSGIANAAKAAAVGLAAAGAAAIAFGVASVKAYSEAEDGIAQTNAVLASTKGIAGVSAQSVNDLSKSLQKSTKYSDEEVRSAENLLLTFTKIGKDIFPQATKTVLNMATALGEDTKSASIQLGKALQDPILGITALRRVGVNFSDAQKDVVKNLVETGRSAEAQQIILKELETEFGGSAEAAGNTFAGALAKLKNQLNDVQETLGATIVKGLQPFAAKAADFVASINWDKVISKSTSALKALAGWFEPIFKVVQETAKEIVSKLKPAFEQIANSKIASYFANYLSSSIQTTVRLFGSLVSVVAAVIKGLAFAAPIVIGVAAGLGAYQAVMTALAIKTWATVAAQSALNLAMSLNPVGLATAAVVGLSVGLFALLSNTDNSSSAINRLKVAQDALRVASDNAKAAQDRLNGALLTQEGSALAVEHAQLNYNEAVRQYGPTSLEARDAAYQLKRANDDLATANANVRDRTNEAAAAEQDKNKAVTAVNQANDSVAASANNAAAGYRNWASAIDAAKEADKKAGGSGSNFSKGAINATLDPGFAGKRAMGGPVSSGSPYFVGDNPDGSLNKTSELFVPRTSGTIVNSRDLQNALGGTGGKSISQRITVNMSGIMARSRSDLRDIAKDMIESVNEELRAKQQPIIANVTGGAI